MHASWLSQHLQENGISPGECDVFDCPLTSDGRTVVFTTGHANEWYGQAVVPAPNIGTGDWPNASFISMQSKTLRDVLDHHSSFDIVASDIQGSEAEVFCGSVQLLTDKVRRVHIGTHGEAIEESLRQAFNDAGWRPLRDFSCGCEHLTSVGVVKFQDGVQTWLSPHAPR